MGLFKFIDGVRDRLVFFQAIVGQTETLIADCVQFSPAMCPPVTPERMGGSKPDERNGSPAPLHPILRRTDIDLDSVSLTPAKQDCHLRSMKSVSPKSQVRFSIPDPSNPDGAEDEEYVPQSPSKIVFPKDSNEPEETEDISENPGFDKHGHFLDMQSRVMLDVPEEIWKFHSRGRSSSSHDHRRATSDKLSRIQRQSPHSHSRTKSLQAMIMDTVTSMSKSSNGFSHESTLRDVDQIPSSNLPRPEIYLSPESPLNTYRLPIPLEISLPPFLSPVNRKKNRRSIIYDGDGYSQFEESSFQKSEEAVSDDSIVSANHEYSFNIDNDGKTNVDETLGIDEHANVNLKAQHRNLRRHQPNRRPEQTRNLEIRSQNQEIIQPSTKANRLVRSNMNNSTAGLTDPSHQNTMSKSLQILSSPSKLISIPDLEHDTQPRSSHGTLQFFDKFENSQQPTIALGGSQDELSPGKEKDQLDLNFTFPKLVQDSDFEKIDSAPTTKGFEDRRSMLMERNLSPNGAKGHRHRRSRSVHNAEDMFAATSTPPKVPTRSPLRSKSPISESSTASQPELISSITNGDGSDASSIYEEEGVNEQLRDGHLGQQNESSSNVGNKTDDSLKIISERKINDSEVTGPQQSITQMTSMHSFKDPINLPEVADTPPIANDFQLNLLSPRRSLSNVGSHSSYNSEFSRRSHTSNATSQPSDCYTPMALPIKSKNAKFLAREAPIRQGAEQEGSSRIRSIYEKRGDKTVEVIVLDDEDGNNDGKSTGTTKEINNLSTHSRKSKSYEEATRNYAKILRMCEQTADQAKDVLLQLIEERNAGDKASHRPPPPLTADVLRNTCEHGPVKPMNGKAIRLSQDSYMRNFERAVRSHSKNNYKHGVRSGADGLSFVRNMK